MKNAHMTRRFEEISRKMKIAFVANPLKGSSAVFLWGPRQTGKTTLLHQQFPKALYYDLLNTSLCADPTIRPQTFREEVLAAKAKVIVIDEIQKVPALLEEVHWLIENTSARIILCGSSARKLRRGARNLLGGRAVDYHLFPLMSHELSEIHLAKMLNHGGLPVRFPDFSRSWR